MLENFPLIDQEPSSPPEWTLLLAIYLITVSVSAKNQLWNQGKRFDYLRRKGRIEINFDNFFLIIIKIFLKERHLPNVSSSVLLLPSENRDHVHRHRKHYRRVLFWGKIFLQKRSKYSCRIDKNILVEQVKDHKYYITVIVGRLGLVMKRPTQRFIIGYWSFVWNLRIWNWGFGDIAAVKLQATARLS